MGIYIDKVLKEKTGVSHDATRNFKEAIVVEHRSNNPKRDFLFVNKYQGKHIPASPKQFCLMVDKLAERVDEMTNHRKDILVIGFAETATALAYELANRIKGYTYYMQTTRENLMGRASKSKRIERIVDFREEHSHAVEQELYGCLGDLCEIDEETGGLFVDDTTGKYKPKNWGYILLVDDEITTGKTVLNIIDKLKERIDITGVGIGVASICNWQSQEDKERFESFGIDSTALITGEIKDTNIKLDTLGVSVYPDSHWKMDFVSPSMEVCQTEDRELEEGILIKEIDPIPYKWSKDISILERCGRKPEDYYREYGSNLGIFLHKGLSETDKRICVIGTEEFMYIPYVAAQVLEYFRDSVTVQATTRSSIDVMFESEVDGIKNKIVLPSVYDKDRVTYLYNIKPYDKVFILTDGGVNMTAFANRLVNIMEHYGNKRENIEIIKVVNR